MYYLFQFLAQSPKCRSLECHITQTVFPTLPLLLLCKIIGLKKSDNSWGDVSQQYEGGTANTKKTLRQKGET